jgi:hypothetical protein
MRITPEPGTSRGADESSPSCLVDLANISKAIAYQESDLGTNLDSREPNSCGYVGLMQVFKKSSSWGFNTSSYSFGHNLHFTDYVTDPEKFNDPFNNIGVGIGCFFDKLIRYEKTYPYSKGYRGAPTIRQWLDASGHYHGSGIDGDYRNNIASIVLYGRDYPYPGNKNEYITLFDPFKYYSRRYIQIVP